MRSSTSKMSQVHSFPEKNNNTSGNYAKDEQQSATHKSDTKEKTVDENVYELYPHAWLKTLQAMADEDRPE